MPDSMIERVARAMEPGSFATYDRGYTQANAFDTRAFLNAEKVVRRARRKARAVVEALREPTEAMVREGFRNNRHVNPTSCGKPTCVGAITLPPVKAYQAMIDAILAEDQPVSPAPTEE